METVAPFIEILDEIKAAGGDVYKLCYQCGLCDVVCPWNKVRTFSIRKIIRQAAFGLTEIDNEEIWRCTTCGSCTSECPRGVGQIELGVSLRRLASEYDVFPDSAGALTTIRANIVNDGNPLQEERKNRADWAKGLSIKPFSEGTEVLFFVGCYPAYDPRMRKVAIATAKILQKAGVDFGILAEKENCCGESMRKTGGEEIFKTLAKENIKTFIDHGVKKILVISPHCYHTFKNEYPEFMVNFEVIHASQYILELIEDGNLQLSQECAKKVTYHDPCYLGRHNDIYDAPRAAMAKIPGLELVEMADSREKSLCCGGGGGRVWMDTPKGERFADLRMEQAKQTGAEVLVTCCPYCITNFEESGLNAEYGAIQVQDITEIIEEAI
ncbi:MAG: (Fe-S)-binding protein [Proteobacteria bacterium]|nr:(Fe-S)-binding protein [Pseudomonadota bacterium]